jgi:hypothetical protein
MRVRDFMNREAITVDINTPIMASEDLKKRGFNVTDGT